MLSEEALKNFKEIWKAEKGTELSDSEAMEEATQLLTLFDAIYRPIKKEWVKEYDDDKSEQTTI